MATTAEIEAAWHDNALAQEIYHDWESEHYGTKWSISFDARCIRYARERFERIAGRSAAPYRHVLEVGAGTGFFSLNLRRAGIVDRITATDISAGMVKVVADNAERLGLEVTAIQAPIERLPFDDKTFDLVIGHAVLHHLPDLDAAMSEVRRILQPGGRFVFAGEPSALGHRYSRALGRWTWRAVMAATEREPLRRWRREDDTGEAADPAAALEHVVDLHTFDPDQLSQLCIHHGFEQVSVHAEEFATALAGWPQRTLEAALKPERLGKRWAMACFDVWRHLRVIDRGLEKVLPAKVFYNLGVTGVKPGGQASSR